MRGGRLPLWHSLLGQNRLRIYSEWQLSEEHRKPARPTQPKQTRSNNQAVDRNHSELSLSLHPVGGLRVPKNTLGLDRGGGGQACACIMGTGLPAHGHPWCALVPVNIWVSTRPRGRCRLHWRSRKNEKLLFSTRFGLGCGRWHEGTAHANIAGHCIAYLPVLRAGSLRPAMGHAG